MHPSPPAAAPPGPRRPPSSPFPPLPPRPRPPCPPRRAVTRVTPCSRPRRFPIRQGKCPPRKNVVNPLGHSPGRGNVTSIRDRLSVRNPDPPDAKAGVDPEVAPGPYLAARRPGRGSKPMPGRHARPRPSRWRSITPRPLSPSGPRRSTKRSAEKPTDLPRRPDASTAAATLLRRERAARRVACGEIAHVGQATSQPGVATTAFTPAARLAPRRARHRGHEHMHPASAHRWRSDVTRRAHR